MLCQRGVDVGLDYDDRTRDIGEAAASTFASNSRRSRFIIDRCSNILGGRVLVKELRRWNVRSLQQVEVLVRSWRNALV